MWRNGTYRSNKKTTPQETTANYGFDSDSDDSSSTVSFYDLCCGYRSDSCPSYMKTEQPIDPCEGRGNRYVVANDKEKCIIKNISHGVSLPSLPSSRIKCDQNYQSKKMWRNGTYRSNKKITPPETTANYGFDSDSDDNSSTVSFYDLCCGYRSDPCPSYMKTDQPIDPCEGRGNRYVVANDKEKCITKNISHGVSLPSLPSSRIKCDQRYQINKYLTQQHVNSKVLHSNVQQRIERESKIFLYTRKSQEREEKQESRPVQDTMMRPRCLTARLEGRNDTNPFIGKMKLPPKHYNFKRY